MKPFKLADGCAVRLGVRNNLAELSCADRYEHVGDGISRNQGDISQTNCRIEQTWIKNSIVATLLKIGEENARENEKMLQPTVAEVSNPDQD